MATNNKKVTWDANTDYQAKINDAVARGDYSAAAKYEQSRNAKIVDTGSNYSTTNNYSSYLNNSSNGTGGGSTTKYSGGSNLVNKAINLYETQKNTASSGGSSGGYSQYTDNSDLGIQGKNLMAANAPWQDVYDVLNARVEKALGTEGLEQYAYDDTYNMMLQYVLDKRAEENRQNSLWENQDYIQNAQPTAPQQDPRIAELLDEILNRDDFSYDVENDPLYQQYAQMYQREGDRAMRDTMAEAAASAGGMNSYAMTAAQQANNYYGAQLNDKIPELYQLAYDMYLADKESKVQDLGILQSLDDTQYNRYRDTMSDWKDDRNFAYDMYRDNVADSQWNKTFDYNKFVDDRNFAYNSDWANKEWNYNVGQDALDREDEERKTARDDVWKFIEMGIPPSAELLAKAGYSDADNKYNGGDTGSYATISNDIASMVAQGDKGGAKYYLQEALNEGHITWSECVGLIEKYGL